MLVRECFRWSTVQPRLGRQKMRDSGDWGSPWCQGADAAGVGAAETYTGGGLLFGVGLLEFEISDKVPGCGGIWREWRWRPRMEVCELWGSSGGVQVMGIHVPQQGGTCPGERRAVSQSSVVRLEFGRFEGGWYNHLAESQSGRDFYRKGKRKGLEMALRSKEATFLWPCWRWAVGDGAISREGYKEVVRLKCV